MTDTRHAIPLSLLQHLAKIADELDGQKLHREADRLTSAMKRLAYDDDYGDSEYNNFERDDDYNVWEENQIFRDQEGREDFGEQDGEEEYLTIEKGYGETYRQQGPGVTLYLHGTYDDSSVLAGQPKRVYVQSFEEFPTEEQNIQAAQQFAAQSYPQYRVDVMMGGSSFIPSEVLTRHLPGEEYDDRFDYPDPNDY